MDEGAKVVAEDVRVGSGCVDRCVAERSPLQRIGHSAGLGSTALRAPKQSVFVHAFALVEL